MRDNLNDPNLRYAVIGSGSWATALVKLLTNNNRTINWYVKDTDTINHINKYRHHLSHLQTIYLDTSKFYMSNNITEIIESSDILIFAIPSAYFISEMSKSEASLKGKFFVSAIKGFVSEDHLTIGEYFNRYHGVPYDDIAIISGPCHAEEVSMGRLSYLTISSKHISLAESICEAFRNEYIKTIAGTDIYGVEYAAALKNIYAVTVGICHGLGYGDNFMSVLITSAYNELVEFLDATYPDKVRVPSTSAYLGDLLVTCYSQFSRNRRFGTMIGKGYSVEAAQLEMNMVAEGYFAANSIHILNKELNIPMPIADAAYKILYEGLEPVKVIKELTEVLH